MTEIFNLFLGGILGIAPAMTITGYICKYGFAGGWPSAFYLSGEIVPRYIHPGIHRDEIAIIFHFDSVWLDLVYQTSTIMLFDVVYP